MAANLAEFDEVYRLEHEQRFTPERTEGEVDVLVRVLDLGPHERVLDLGCGWGRHLAELKKLGFENLVGVDAQGAFLEPIPGVTMLEGDAARLEFGAEFDAVYCAFNALFSAPDVSMSILVALSVFSGVAGALKPSGRFLFDTTNRERLVTNAPTRTWRGGGDLPWVLEETCFDLLTCAQTIVQKRLFADGRSDERTLTRFHHTLAELVRLLQSAGLTVTDVYGDWQNPYTAQSARTMLLTRKDR